MQKSRLQKKTAILCCGLAIDALAWLATGSLPAAAQSGVYTPRPGSPERRDIMNALRVPVEKDLAYNASPETKGKFVKIPVVFKIPDPKTFLRVSQNWAFVYAVLCHPDGTEFRYDTPVAVALLHRSHRRWSVIAHETGLEVSPFPWGKWSRQYHTPPGLFPRIQ